MPVPNFRFRFRGRRRESGQTLLFGVLSLIVILIGILILFDIHSVIRGKVKAQTAVDAAAVAGANWQMHSLNLIGELNLIKACTVLISDSVYGWGTDPETLGQVKEYSEYESPEEFQADITRVEEEMTRLEETAELLTQMQTRVSFVGPLIGYGAAQQAAKNNGLTSNPDAGEFNRIFLQDILDETIYGHESVPQEIHGYYWRLPYAAMLESILDVRFPESGSGESTNIKGIAVGTKILRLGTPEIYCDPPSSPDFTSYLTSKSLYAAIAADYWCALRSILKMSYGPKWWGELRLGRNDTFIGESEVLPLHTEFFSGQSPYDSADGSGVLDAILQTRSGLSKHTSLSDTENPYEYEAVRDEEGNLIQILIKTDPATGEPVRNANDTDLRFNILPRITWATYDSYWTNYDEETKNLWTSDYLRGNFQQGMEYYSGALSYFVGSQETTTLSGSLGELPGDTDSSSDGTLGEALDFHGKGSLGRSESAFASRMSSAENSMKRTVPEIQVDALAKPLGRIKVESSYKPPFYVGMVLPVFTRTSLIPVALEPVYGMSSIDLDWYLFITKFLPALGTVDSIDAALAKLDSDTRRRTSYYANLLKKLDDPEWRQKGLDWLAEEVSGHYVYDKDGHRIGYVVDSTNEDHCDDWPTGGGGGHRTGPGKLH